MSRCVMSCKLSKDCSSFRWLLRPMGLFSFYFHNDLLTFSCWCMSSRLARDWFRFNEVKCPVCWQSRGSHEREWGCNFIQGMFTEVTLKCFINTLLLAHGWALCIVTYHKLCHLAFRLTFLLSLVRWCLVWKKQKSRKPQCLNHWVCELSFCLIIMNCVSFFINFLKCYGLDFEGLAIEDVMSAKLVQQLMKMNWGFKSLQIA